MPQNHLTDAKKKRSLLLSRVVEWRRVGDYISFLRPEMPKVFEWVSLVLPARLYKEDLGDALELLAQLETKGASRWQRRLKIACTCFWLLVNTVRELTSVVHGAAAKRKGGDQ